MIQSGDSPRWRPYGVHTHMVRYCAVLAALIWVNSLEAAVVSTRASVSTHVQELIAESPASVNSDDGEFPAEGVELPLVASASVTSTDLNGALAGFGRGSCVFADPTRLDQPNPEEFAVEAGCYSNVGLLSYRVTAQADEFRAVRFDRSEVGTSLDDEHDIRSRVFLSGAVVLWSTGAESGSVLGNLRVSVVRDEDAATLFDTTLHIEGGEIEGTGPIRFEQVGLDELASLGVDDASIVTLRQIEDAGRLLVLAIPAQEHEYTYTIRLDETSTLHARIETSLSNGPDGTGVAVTLGRPFSELTALVGTGLPGVDGEALQKSINQAVARRAIGLVSAQDVSSEDTAAALPRYCGALGVLPLLGLFMGLALMERTRTRNC